VIADTRDFGIGGGRRRKAASSAVCVEVESGPCQSPVSPPVVGEETLEVGLVCLLQGVNLEGGQPLQECPGRRRQCAGGRRAAPAGGGKESGPALHVGDGRQLISCVEGP
jgi:hypothetical protein